MTITLDHAGAHATVQDLGRPTHRSAGVPVGGAADRLALRVANLLVGNHEGAAALECALVEPVVRFSARCVVAICGARAANRPHWQAFEVAAGESLSLARLEQGSYAYLAVAGGIDVPPVLGSRSTDARIGWGGHGGRVLRRGDVLQIGLSAVAATPLMGRVHHEPWYAGDVIRFVRGRDWNEFGASFAASTFSVTTRSDRMGVRLSGPPLERRATAEPRSAVVAPGTIQVPPDGQPIVLLADAQTMGGYPIVAHAIAADLPRLAQRRPGATLRFVEVSLEAAHDLRRRQERDLAFLRQAIAMAHRS